MYRRAYVVESVLASLAALFLVLFDPIEKIVLSLLRRFEFN